MTVNFEITDSNVVVHDGRRIDLHNNFDFIGYYYNIGERKLTLTWAKSTGDWVTQEEFLKLKFVHYNAFYINISYDNKEYEFPNDDKCLSDISFFPSSDRQTNNAFLFQEQPKVGDDIIYIFETEHFIRVGCDNVELEAER
jgi:hypothetical protein